MDDECRVQFLGLLVEREPVGVVDAWRAAVATRVRIDDRADETELADRALELRQRVRDRQVRRLRELRDADEAAGVHFALLLDDVVGDFGPEVLEKRALP